MEKEVILVDKDLAYLFHLCEIAEENGLVPRTFLEPSDVLYHLGTGEKPLAYFVNTNFTAGFPAEHLFGILCARGEGRKVYFMSTFLSDEDKKLIKKTQAEFLWKRSKENSVEEKLENLTCSAER